MKRGIVLILFFAFCLSVFSRISVECDVIYQRTDGSWSDFYRTNVEFVSGYELGYTNNRNLYAVIWFSQDNCAVLEMEQKLTTLRVVDIYYMFGFLLSDDLNQGLLGIEVNNSSGRQWRIYGKNENSFLIDSSFNYHPFNSYNERMLENIQNGFVLRRTRPN